MLRFNDIADRVLKHDPNSDLHLLQRAYVYTAKVHDGQERLSGEPYLVHPLEVAGILADMRMDAVTITAGLLHDAVEDTHSTVDEISDKFGEEVGFLVEGLTKIAKIEFKSARERQAENFRKMLIAMSKDIRILMVKLADRLHNMRTLEFMNEPSRSRIAQETLDIYVPLAHRLGIYWMRRELEELSFRALKPLAASELEQKLRGAHTQRTKYIDEVIGVLSNQLALASLEGEVTGRLKDLASIHNKMESQGISLDEIYDVIAFRIVLSADEGAVYTALGLVHATWSPVPGRFKDHVALPRPNGYQSLHTTVIGPYGERMEVQIRTEQMHRNAEFGIAAHWRYKQQEERVDAEDHEKFAWLRQLIEHQVELSDPHEFFDTVKVDLFPDEVFVFTPKGDVINVPKGGTPIDFAYAVHSEIGDSCFGAKVNGKMVTLSHRLSDGDTVEIESRKSEFPKKDWLNFVVSAKAKSRIRHAIRLEENASSRELGRGILERELRRAGFSLLKLEKDGDLNTIARNVVNGSKEDLYAAVGYGRVPAARLVRSLRPDWKPDVPQRKKSRVGLRNIFSRESRKPEVETGVRVQGQEGVLIRYGKCCNPLPGDEIVGFVTRGRGVTLHQNDCRVVFSLDPERRIEVEWDAESKSAPRLVRVRVTSRDEPGLLAEVTKTISTAGINIGAARIETHSNRTATQTFDLWVAHLGVLSEVMREIEIVRGVVSVERLRA